MQGVDRHHRHERANQAVTSRLVLDEPTACRVSTPVSRPAGLAGDVPADEARSRPKSGGKGACDEGLFASSCRSHENFRITACLNNEAVKIKRRLIKCLPERLSTKIAGIP